MDNLTGILEERKERNWEVVLKINSGEITNYFMLDGVENWVDLLLPQNIINYDFFSVEIKPEEQKAFLERQMFNPIGNNNPLNGGKPLILYQLEIHRYNTRRLDEVIETLIEMFIVGVDDNKRLKVLGAAKRYIEYYFKEKEIIQHIVEYLIKYIDKAIEYYTIAAEYEANEREVDKTIKTEKIQQLHSNYNAKQLGTIFEKLKTEYLIDNGSDLQTWLFLFGVNGVNENKQENKQEIKPIKWIGTKYLLPYLIAEILDDNNNSGDRWKISAPYFTWSDDEKITPGSLKNNNQQANHGKGTEIIDAILAK